MMDKIRSFLTVRRICILLAAVYILLLIPLLYIGIYDRAGADDFSEGYTTYLTFMQTGSFLKTVGAAARHAVHDYLNWMGYFSSTFIMALHPGVFAPALYGLTPLILIGSLTAGVLFLFETLFTRVFGTSRELSLSVAFIVLIITTQNLPGANEAFYWFCGGCNYTLFFGLALIFLGLMLRLRYPAGPKDAASKQGGKKRIVLCVITSLRGFFVGGGNYMTALCLAMVLAAAPVFAYLTDNRERKGRKGPDPLLLVPAAAFAAGFLMSCFAPGNSTRESISTGMGAVKAVLTSLYYFFDMCVDDWTGWAVIAGFILLVPFFVKAALETDFSFKHPLLVFLFGYGLVSANVTPPLYAVGNIQAGRLQALFFMQYIPVMVLCWFYAIGYTVKRFGIKSEGSSIPGIRAALVLCLFILFGSALCVKVDPYYFTSSAAAADIANGSAARYAAALDERTRIMEAGKGEDLVFEPLPDEPYLLYFDDMMEDTKDWRNGAVARYYGMSSVSVKGRK